MSSSSMNHPDSCMCHRCVYEREMANATSRAERRRAEKKWWKATQRLARQFIRENP